MSNTSGLRPQILFLVTFLTGFLLGHNALVLADDDNLLKKTIEREKVSAQKLEREVKDALAQVRKTYRAKPHEARRVLITYQHVVDNTRILPEKNRVYLSKGIKAYIEGVDAYIQKKASNDPEAQRRAKYQKYAKYAKRQPTTQTVSGPGSVAERYIKTARGRTGEIAQQKRRFEVANRSTLDLGDITIPENGRVSFPKNWVKRSEIRANFAGVKLNEKDAFLLKTLNSVMTVDFDGWRFQDVLEYMAKKTKAPILSNKLTLEDVGVTYDTVVNFRPKGKLTVRTILKTVLANNGLAYILKDGTIQVVTPEVARNTLTTRSYPISDLLPPPDPRFGQLYNLVQQRYAANSIMRMIVTTINPSSWAYNGGRGTIAYNEVTGSIVIRNSAELHFSLANGFGG
ncbi:MAG: hypothetical protein ACFCD0_03765 [Gemmataceae bacterium]